MIKKSQAKSKERGQGLVEYALLLALVAVVAMVSLAIIGLVNSRSYGQVAAVLGAQRMLGDSNSHYLHFNNPPRCGYLHITGQPSQGIGLYAQGTTDVPFSELAATTENNLPLDITSNAGITGAGGVGFKAYLQIVQPPPAGDHDLSKCPHSIVIQSSPAYGGMTILAPVIVEDWNAYP